jgi:iron(III) transport system substrate-binding protein
MIRRRHLALSLAVVIASACSFLPAAGGATPTATAPHPLSASAWRALAAKAKQEGTVTYYSGQSTVSLTPLAAAFEKKYGIKVVINRVLDNVSRQQVNAEITTGKAIADVWELSSRAITLGVLKNGWVADAVGPHLFTKRFDRKRTRSGKRS